MLELYKMRMGTYGSSISEALKRQSDQIMNASFKSNVGYCVAKLYDQNQNFLEEVELQLMDSQNYTTAKDEPDFMVQFRPHYHPEKKYHLYPDDIDKDGNLLVERLGFYLEIPDDDGQMSMWLIVGKTDSIQFTSYVVLKCNWTVRWVKNGTIHKCLGVVRTRNNYNSGEWSDGFVTSVEDQDAFWLPTNDITQTIVYNDRFILADRKNDPPTFHVSKISDTHPIGVTKFTLVQEHFNPKTDNAELKIADYYSPLSENVPQEEKEIVFEETEQEIVKSKIEINSNNNRLIVGGTKKQLSITYFNTANEQITNLQPTTWNLSGELQGVLYTDDYLRTIVAVTSSADDNSVLSLQINKSELAYKLIGMSLKITANLGDRYKETCMELEVAMR